MAYIGHKTLESLTTNTITIDDLKHARSLSLVLGIRIGSGTFSDVFIAKYKSRRVAVKFNDKRLVREKYNDQELVVINILLRAPGHRNVIRFLDLFENYSRSQEWILMELFDGRELYDKIMENNGPFAERVAKQYMKQMVDGLAYLHGLTIVHRDIKPSNVMIKETNGQQLALKYIDFGFSRVVDISNNGKAICSSHVGTDPYMAPEVFDKEEDYNAFKSDIYSVGVILYVMIYWINPFYGQTRDDIIRLKQKPVEFPDDMQVSDSVRQLLANILCLDPINRFHINQILDSDWMKQ
ncbi:testis-specific serine/threonine-protein kinase 3-like [Oppia nitens]|uniref:testis-specific serine/threonine-protein kinase 3-like n=1 Tax=Oppia nitens TaxID=1686743 RepID=UPI0023DCEB76|nr:testis-specific serine/threonine-protein kinase 3-like [Oppia nitens]